MQSYICVHAPAFTRTFMRQSTEELRGQTAFATGDPVLGV